MGYLVAPPRALPCNRGLEGGLYRQELRQVEPETTHGAGRGFPRPASPFLALRLPSPHPRQLLLDHAGEAFQRLGARDQPAVDEEGRSTSHASAGALLDVLLHGGLVCAAADALLEGWEVQPDLLGIGLQLLANPPKVPDTFSLDHSPRSMALSRVFETALARTAVHSRLPPL